MVRARSKISVQSEHSTVRVTGLFMRNLFVRQPFFRYLLSVQQREYSRAPNWSRKASWPMHEHEWRNHPLMRDDNFEQLILSFFFC